MRNSEYHSLELARDELRRLYQATILPDALQERLVRACSTSVQGMVEDLSRLMEELVERLYVRRHPSPNRSKNPSAQLTDLGKAGVVPDHVLCATRTAIMLRNHFAHPLDKHGRQRQYPNAFGVVQVKALEVFLPWLVATSWGHDIVCSAYPTALSHAAMVERLLKEKLSQELHSSPICSLSYAAKAALAESRDSVTLQSRNWKLPDDVDVLDSVELGTHRRSLEIPGLSIATASIQPAVVGALAALGKIVSGLEQRLYSFGVELLEAELQRDDPADILITVDGAMAICNDPRKFLYRRVLPIHNEFQWVLCRSFDGQPRLNAVHFIPNSTGEVQYWSFRHKGILPKKFAYVDAETIAASIHDGNPNQGYIVWDPLANAIIEQGLAIKVPGIPRFTNWISLYARTDTMRSDDTLNSLISSFCAAWSECANDIDSVAHHLSQDAAYLATFEKNLLL